MESFMDEVKVESIVGLGTKVTMKKLIKKDNTLATDKTYEKLEEKPNV